MRDWILGGVGSIAAHGVMLAGLGLTLLPEPPAQQPVPKSKLTVSSYQVERLVAPVAKPEGEAAEEGKPTSPRVGAGSIARSRAEVSEPKSEPVEAVRSEGEALAPSVERPETVRAKTAIGVQAKASDTRRQTASKPVTTKSETVARIETDGSSLNVVESAGVALMAVAAKGDLAVSGGGSVLTLETSPAQSDVVLSGISAGQAVAVLASTSRAESLVVSATAKGEVLGVGDAVGTIAREARSEQVVLSGGNVSGETAPALRQTGTALEEQASKGVVAGAQDLPSEFATAALAWTGDEERVVDPVSLAAIQAFMQPSDLVDAGAQNAVRDGIEAVLASVPCARLQTVFEPTTGRLQLRGHIPETGLRDPVLEALRQEIGGAIPIDDNLLILPRPQCGALSGIANVGLPQSTDQITNPRVVGPEGFARNYSYSNGERLILELTAPDYPSVVYVDYFTADGMVLHLQPNEIVPLEAFGPKSLFTVGKDRGDKPSLNLTVTPPFGQEIAVAFAASVPVYEGLRPISEPAGPYLSFLRGQISELRARDSNFKGEWVYFFISTRAN